MRTLILLALNLVAFGLVLRLGRTGDRLAVGFFAASIALTPFAETWTLGTWRLGMAVIDTALLLGLWILAERCERWWLTAVAGFQLIVVSTFALPWFVPDQPFYVWATVTVRIAAWVLISITLFAGAWEAWADRRYRDIHAATLHRRRPDLA